MRDSIDAYNAKSRVEKYDADMDIMHPNRFKMVDIVLEFMSFNSDAPLRALDLGVGTGFFTKKFLEKFPNAHVVALDGAASMIESAQSRLGSLVSSVDFVVADFKDLDSAIDEALFDVVFSSFALHHLTSEEKSQMLAVVLKRLKPEGLFFNADNIIAETADVEKRFQELRVEGIIERAGACDERFKDFANTRAYLDKMEAAENDMPIKLTDELKIMTGAGFEHVNVLWKEYREVVLYGVRKQQ